MTIDDGSNKPNGYVTEDGLLEVRDGEYHETLLGQHDRWMRQAPDLFEMYQAALSRIQELESKEDTRGTHEG